MKHFASLDGLEKSVFTFLFILQPKTTGEQKTKPTQSSVRELRGLGISPDIVSSHLHIQHTTQWCFISRYLRCKFKKPSY